MLLLLLLIVLIDTTIYERVMMDCTSANPENVESLSQRMKANDEKLPLQPMTVAAAVHENANVFRYCLKQGAVFDLEVDKASARASSPQMLKLLYDANWRNIKTDHDALDKVLTSSVGKGQSCVAFLLDQGARVQPTTLSTAAFNPPSGADVPTMALLLSRGGQQKNSGALQLAAGRGRLDMVKLLLDAGADIDEIATNAPGDRMDGWPATALHEAIAGSRVEVVRYLLAHGARPDVHNRNGQTAVDLARSHGKSQILELLAPQGADKL